MKKVYIFVLCICCVSCVQQGTKRSKNVVAKVYNFQLTKEDIKGNLPKTNSVVDSLKVAEDYIKNWAKQKVLYRNALINLDNTDQLDKLVAAYKQELYVAHYKNALVNKKLDTLVSESDIEAFYENHKNNFLLNEVVLKFKYLHVDRRNRKRNVIKKLFQTTSLEDKHQILSKYSGYQDFYFNDSTWVSLKSIYTKKINFPELTPRDLSIKNKVITKLGSDKSLYFIQIKQVLTKNAIAPLEYVKPNVENILLHKNKIKFFDQMEQILIDDAVKQNKYEVY